MKDNLARTESIKEHRPRIWRRALPGLSRMPEAMKDLTGVKVVAIAALSVATLLGGMRSLGGVQPLELAAYDQMVRMRSDLASDPRLLIVEITEQDLQVFNQFPLSDQLIARLLQKLQTLQPRLIGLDLYRNIPIEPGRAELQAQLREPNVIVIRKLPDVNDRGVPAPFEVPKNRVGFNDLPVDPDNVIRRFLLYGSSPEGTVYSFALRLATLYLQPQNISLHVTPNQELQLGGALFERLQPSFGGYQTIDATGYQILLNYRSRTPVARQISLTQLLYGRIDPSWVKDKIVLIGTTAPSSKDLFITPYSPEKDTPQMAGVLIHAQILSQILSASLDQNPEMRAWSETAEISWMIAWSVAGGVLCWTIRHPLKVILASTGSLAGLAIASFSLFSASFPVINTPFWVPVATPTLAFVLSGATVLTIRGYAAGRQQQIVMKLLGQNTSPEIAKALWNSRDNLLKSGKLPGQKLIATLLFTDIQGFSTIAEQIPPEQLLEWLNELLGAITEEVTRHQGIINKFTGDGIMAVFGVPIPRMSAAEIAEDAQHAVNCALGMEKILERLNQSWMQRNLPLARMRVGIFTGPVVVGSLGGKNRLEYGVIGDSVNIASRLESCEKDRQPTNCRILIAQETLDYLQGQFEVEAWGPLALKGKQQMVEVYRVLGSSNVHPVTTLNSLQKIEQLSKPVRLK